jgi:hypothetical protein
MLDLRTLAFALTDKGYSLDSACKAFGVEHGKQHVTRHGVVTKKYIDYNRRDVQATSELAVKLLAEYAKHPINLQPTKAYSPASIGKAYLRTMGILPILERQPDFPLSHVGFAQTAFFGGRTSAHIRKVPVPVVYVDFLSMYPTVNGLMDLWKFVIATEIRVVTPCQREIERFLRALTPEKLFLPNTWEKLPAFVKVVPDGDLLPSRAKYSSVSNDWQVAMNHLFATDHAASQGLWFSLPDVAVSVLLTGKVPKIVDAFKLVPVGKSPDLRPVRLSGEVWVNPRTQDLFRTVIEQRKSNAKKKRTSREDADRLDKALKVLANATSYGIYAEMNRQETEERVKVQCQGIDPEPYECSVIHPEKPGEFCFPPFGFSDYGGRPPNAGVAGTFCFGTGGNLRHGRYRFHGDRCDKAGRNHSLQRWNTSFQERLGRNQSLNMEANPSDRCEVRSPESLRPEGNPWLRSQD